MVECSGQTLPTTAKARAHTHAHHTHVDDSTHHASSHRLVVYSLLTWTKDPD